LLTFSCSKFDKSKITIVDNIVLGQSESDFNKSLDSLNLKEEIFYTETAFLDYESSLTSKVKARSTKQFDYANLKNIRYNHIGILYPVTNESFNVTELNVLLVHTSPAILVSNSGITDLTKSSEIYGYVQV